MAASPHAAKLAAYSTSSAHGGVAAADPHGLIILLMDGALERIATARGCIVRGEVAEKAKLVNRAVLIISELRACLDMSAGRQIAANLGQLYEYMSIRLLKGSIENRTEMLDEVCNLLHEVRGAWLAIPAEARRR